MKKLTPLLSVIFVICFQLSAVAQAPAQAEVQKELGAVLKAPYVNKLDLILGHMHPKLIEMSGGKEALKKVMVQMFAQIKGAGVGFVSAKVGEPYSYMKSDQREYFLVDVDLVLSVGEKQLANKITQIVIKDKGSETWTYTDTSGIDDATFRQLFPDAPKEFSFAKKQEPAKELAPQP